MKKAYIIHGWPQKEEYFDKETPAPSNNHWIPWLEKQLLINKVHAQAIAMPEAWKPDYEKWSAYFSQFTIDQDTILVGHSCGAGFLMRWLSERKIRVGAVALIAPWIDLEKNEVETIGDFFDFKIDPTLSDRTNGVAIFISDDDDHEILDTVKFLEENLKGYFTHGFSGKGHFTLSSMGGDEFPELLKNLMEK